MTVSWFVQTRGQKPHQDYLWLAVDPDADPQQAAEIVDGHIGLRRASDYLSDRTPSLLVARCGDGSFLFLANNLRPPSTPAGGDHAGRPIHATLMGTTRDEFGSLLDAADAAIAGNLAAVLPLDWVDGTPVIAPSGHTWGPPKGNDSSSQVSVNARASSALPASAAADAKQTLARLRAADPDALDRGRVLLASPGDAGTISEPASGVPRRTRKPEAPEPKAVKEDKRGDQFVLVVLGLAVGIGFIVLLYWLVQRLAGGR
ncbi:hypothetical protein [Micromonospora haikouensis]|uniref:hypothetical protein n=1 Tax=Micromonospora haikouensis TaxID=686309 RepID=UPI003D73597C